MFCKGFQGQSHVRNHRLGNDNDLNVGQSVAGKHEKSIKTIVFVQKGVSIKNLTHKDMNMNMNIVITPKSTKNEIKSPSH